jgi:inner membrane protein involved in colicin E2 resistance
MGATRIGSMSSHRFFRIATLFLMILSTVFAFAQQDKRGRKYKAPPSTMKIDISVVRATTGKPIPNAAVIFHPVNEKGKQEGGMELKTDLEGKTALDVIPIGSTVRLQIIANGFQTFGNDYVANADAKEITIKMQRPTSQYSIYKGNATGDQSGQAQEKTTKPESQKPN